MQDILALQCVKLKNLAVLLKYTKMRFYLFVCFILYYTYIKNKKHRNLPKNKRNKGQIDTP